MMSLLKRKTVSEIAQDLRVKQSPVRKLAREGEIANFRVGRLLRFSSDAAEKFAERQIKPNDR
jgi:excisionase family DNA binding protein